MTNPLVGQKREVGWEHPWKNHIFDRQLVLFFTHRRKLAFYSQLLDAVKSGISLREGLALMAARQPKGAVSSALRQAVAEIERGKNLRDALSPHAHLFNRHYIELIGFGEEVGSLDRVLTKIIEDLEQQQSMRRKAFLPSVYLFYLFFTLVLVGPFAGIGAAIHSGDIEGSLGSALRYYALGLAGNVLLLFVLTALYLALPVVIQFLGAQSAFDRFKTTNVITGPLFRNLYAGRFFVNLALAVSFGMRMDRAVALSASATGSPYIRDRVPDLVSSVDRGMSLTETLSELDVFPEDYVGALALSERAGRLDEALSRLARDAEESTVHCTKVLFVGVMASLALLFVVLIAGEIFTTVFEGPLLYYRDMDKFLESLRY